MGVQRDPADSLTSIYSSLIMTTQKNLLTVSLILACASGTAVAGGGGPGTGSLGAFTGGDDHSVIVHQNDGTGNQTVQVMPDYRDAIYDNTFSVEVWTIATSGVPSDKISSVPFGPGNTPSVTIGPGQEVRVQDGPDADSKGTKGTASVSPG